MLSAKFDDFIINLYDSAKPSEFINSLDDSVLIQRYPELYILKQTEQEPEWHPEGDVFKHTMLVIDRAAELRDTLTDADDKAVLMLSALCHDFGKPDVTSEKNGRIVSPGHEGKGVEPTRTFLERMKIPELIINRVTQMVAEHLKPSALYKNRHNVSDSAIKRLIHRVDIDMLLLVAKSDHFGRTTEDAIRREFPAGEWLKARTDKVIEKDKKPKPFLNGKILLSKGVPPSKVMSKILTGAYHRQMLGKINNVSEAIAWFENSYPEFTNHCSPEEKSNSMMSA
jgi:tRNA nucleotidyltransferase (CCA-adding enzyme)